MMTCGQCASPRWIRDGIGTCACHGRVNEQDRARDCFILHPKRGSRKIQGMNVNFGASIIGIKEAHARFDEQRLREIMRPAIERGARCILEQPEKRADNA